MNDKNFINFHILISHSPSCLNRDDMNMQKSAIFGGARRVRISSQSLKRAMRTSDYYKEHLGQPSKRTRELGKLQEKYVAALTDRYSEAQVTRALEWISGKEGLAELSVAAIAVAPWIVDEVAYFCDVIAEAGEDADKKKLAKQIEKDSQPLRQAMSSAVDIALSGRMATSGLMSNMDGAMALAHTITTHSVDADIDWFTAVDDLVQEERERRIIGETVEGKSEQGSGHLNTQELSSGVFYRYASINLAHLQKNLGDVSRERALEIAQHVLHMFATVVPTAKNQSTAPFNLADYALVTFSDIPVSLANAFETPVPLKHKKGFLKPSIAVLRDYWLSIHKGYGLDEIAAEFQLNSRDQKGGLLAFNALPELENWVANNASGVQE